MIDTLLNPEETKESRFKVFCICTTKIDIRNTQLFLDICQDLYPEWNEMISLLPGLRRRNKCFSNFLGVYDLKHIQSLLKFCERLSKNNIFWNVLRSEKDNVFEVIKAFSKLIDSICSGRSNIDDPNYQHYITMNMWRVQNILEEVDNYNPPTDEDFNITGYYPKVTDINLLSEKYYITNSRNIRLRTK